MHDDRGGRIFRQAWIDGVNAHYPNGNPKDSYIAPWDNIPEWERAAAEAVYQQLAQFITLSDGNTSYLTRDQKSQWVALCWIPQIHKHIADPKPGYVAPWDKLPDWQKEVDADIFEAIERAVATEAPTD
ncbi:MULTISPECIES: hypothetical protein [unclassified Nocardia]|uniref:hypothetical protein n=1 Tax=unclassified Nocardia TaxID=2637762 RepID=UPI001CE4044E|nr:MULTISPECIES: hypothetical protein [unclassified Nocardia]